jgi:hypothetical protein
MRLRLTVLVVLLVATPIGTFAQSQGPSLADTVNWIGQQIEGSTIDVKGTSSLTWFRREYSHSGFQATQNSCLLTWITHTRRTEKNAPPSERDDPSNLGLGGLSPSASVQEWHMPDSNFVGSGDYPYYDIHLRNYKGQDVPFLLGGLSFGDKDVANRVATAFNHAIELCGGKKEPF